MNLIASAGADVACAHNLGMPPNGSKNIAVPQAIAARPQINLLSESPKLQTSSQFVQPEVGLDISEIATAVEILIPI